MLFCPSLSKRSRQPQFLWELAPGESQVVLLMGGRDCVLWGVITSAKPRDALLSPSGPFCMPFCGNHCGCWIQYPVSTSITNNTRVEQYLLTIKSSNRLNLVHCKDSSPFILGPRTELLQPVASRDQEFPLGKIMF